MPRVEKDIRRSIVFVGRQPWGKPHDREMDIALGIAKVRACPEDNRPELRLPDTGLWMCRPWQRSSSSKFAMDGNDPAGSSH